MADIDALKDRIEQRAKTAPKLGAVVCLDLNNDGVIQIDGRDQPADVGLKETERPKTRLTMKAETLKKILDGQQDPTLAVMMGKIKIKGSTGLAMKLGSILED
jgi:putative sterol carrier protein